MKRSKNVVRDGPLREAGNLRPVRRRERFSMDLLELTLSDPFADVALDEALLCEAEEQDDGREVLRLWEPRRPMVVVGRGSKVEIEVNLDECRRAGVPVVRRCSGGAAIVAGPGCLMYSLVLRRNARPDAAGIEATHRFVLGALAEGLARLGFAVLREGTSDLTYRGKKISGNSMRCRRNFLLYHGTMLYRFPIDLIDRLLLMPPRRPAYRGDRAHAQFVANLDVEPAALRAAIAAAFQAETVRSDWPRELTETLVRNRYAQDDWNR